MLQNQVIDTLAALQRFFGYLRRSLVTDNGVEGCDDTDGVFDGFQVVLTVDGDAVDTFLAENLHHVLQPGDGFEDTLGDNRFHHVQL